MTAVTAAYRAATTGSHRAVARVEVRAFDGVLLSLLRPSAGSVTVNYSAAVRRTCSLTVPNPAGAFSPRELGDLLNPLGGNELHVYKGIRLSGAPVEDGTEELYPLGVFPITEATPERGADGPTLAVAGMDRAENIIGRVPHLPYQYPLGLLTDALTVILTDRWPDVPLDLGAHDAIVNSGVVTDGADAWALARKLAADNGLDLAFDADGVCRLRPVPDPATMSRSWTYGPTGARALLRVAQPISRADVRTGVVIRVQNPANEDIHTGLAWDTNPASPTFSGGPLGRRPDIYDSPSITSDETAQGAAESRLRMLSGRSNPVDVSMVPNAALDVAEVIGVHIGDDVEATPVFIDQITMPVTAQGEAILVCRTTTPTEDSP